MHFLSTDLNFPPVEEASITGLLAVGGDLSPLRLLLAYKNGIFPWFESEEPILWWSPSERMVVDPKTYKAPKSLRSLFNKNLFEIRYNTAFREVITACQKTPRDGQEGTWITDQMLEAYCLLNKMGHATSVEVYQNENLVGGLYGVDLGHVYCGESMFSKASNASKIAFVWLIEKLKNENYLLLDCQLHNEHLERLGAFEISRETYLKILHKNEFLSNEF
ncbi:MAG: leucyl/phenylalanyl-tRNA--protein transferase [Flavobacterium sp.]